MAKQQIEQEIRYDILKNQEGEMLIKIRARMDDAKNPMIVYDGKEHAVLYRNEGNVIVLDYIHQQARSSLSDAKRVLVVEAQDGAIIREYRAGVQQVKQVPLPMQIL